jgi:DNA invertase Pin-like site-specific DNA recombinase
VVENDVDENGRRRPASAYKRRKITTPSGRTELRVIRPGFRSVIDRLTTGATNGVLAEDLDRTVRDPRDGEDLIDACAARGASARSLTGSLKLTDGGDDAEVTIFRVLLAFANKSSRDTARRVADHRERQAGAGRYGGGRRPYGYETAAGTLAVVPAEAAELRKAAHAVLAGVSLRALARDLRDRNVATVTGARWTPDTLRGCLLAPVCAGLAAHTTTVRANGDAPRKVTTLHPASWPAIIDRELWQAVTDKLTDPSRTTNPGTEPKWLASGIARCHCGELVYVRASCGRPSYVCRGPSQHLRRLAPAVDDYVARVIVARLSRPDAADLLRPPARPGIDAPALRTEAAQLRERKSAQMRMHAAGAIDDADLTAGLAEIKRRLTAIEVTLTANSAPDPLSEFRDQVDAGAVWEALPLARKRAVVKLLADITLLATTRRGRGFDEASVSIGPAVAPIAA